MLDPDIFRKMSYGLYVVSSAIDGRLNGQIANTAFQVTAEPAMIAIGINKSNLTHQFIESSGIFTISILPRSVSLDLIAHFGFKSGRDIDKYASIPYKLGETGAPYLLRDCVGYLEARVLSRLDAKTHTLFLGQVVDSAVFSGEEPLTYAYYQQRKRMPAGPPEPAPPPGREEAEVRAGDPADQKYQCTICGYVYDPLLGDPDSGIAPGTAFADIPGDWVCPICGVNKDQFEPVA